MAIIKNKRPFILLEVLIALFIVVVCAAPLLSSQVFMYKAEKRFLQKLEAERIVKIVFADVVMDLYEKNGISWRDIQNSTLFLYDPNKHPQNGLPKHLPYKISYSMKAGLRKPKGDQRPINFMVLLAITLVPINDPEAKMNYEYKLFISRNIPEGQIAPLDEMLDRSMGLEEADDEEGEEE